MALGVKLWLSDPMYCYRNIWPYNKVTSFFIIGTKFKGVVPKQPGWGWSGGRSSHKSFRLKYRMGPYSSTYKLVHLKLELCRE
jgi:hypothetical protein